MPDLFNLAEVQQAITGTPFAGKLLHLRSTPSTNTLALEAAQSGAPHGSVWIADEQTAGRGRGGHTWHSTAGDGLYASVLLRPQIPLQNVLWLSLATGLAVQQAIADVAQLKADIRWPNDILVGKRKCGGILVETSISAQQATPTSLRYAVIGIGLNLNHESFPDEIKELATSLRLETGKTCPREQILPALLRALDSQILLLQKELEGQQTAPGLLDRFSAASTWVRGKRVTVDEDGGYTGLTDGLDAQGFLRVAGSDGLLHTVRSGGVRTI